MGKEKTSDGDALVPGRKPVLELLLRNAAQVSQVLIKEDAHGAEIDRIFALCREGGTPFQVVKRERLDRLHSGVHQGVIAKTAPLAFVDEGFLASATKIAPLPVILALDGVEDPGNLGTLARTLVGVGAGGMLLPKHGHAALGPGAMKASAGALTRLNIARTVNLGRGLEALKDEGFRVYGAASGGVPFTEANLALPAVLVLGGEEKGIREGVWAKLDETLAIPLPGGLDSLNAAQAGAMLLGAFMGKAVSRLDR